MASTSLSRMAPAPSTDRISYPVTLAPPRRCHPLDGLAPMPVPSTLRVPIGIKRSLFDAFPPDGLPPEDAQDEHQLHLPIPRFGNLQGHHDQPINCCSHPDGEH